MKQGKHSDQADDSGLAPRRNRLGRLMWTRALPGSVAVIAALTVPEFSLGAGDLASPKRDENRFEPNSARGQGAVKWQANAGKQQASVSQSALAGVRSAALLEIEPANPPDVPGTAIAALSDRVIASDPVAALPSLLVETRAPVTVSATVAVSLPEQAPFALLVIEPALAEPAAITAAMRADMVAVLPAADFASDPLVLYGMDAGSDRFVALLPAQDDPALQSSAPASLAVSPARAALLPDLDEGRTPPGDYGGIEQLTPSLAVASLPASSPAATIAAPPRATPATLARTVPLASAPAARAPMPVKPAATPPAAVIKPPPFALAAVAVPPGPAKPLAAPTGVDSRVPAAPDITSRLTTRVDGQTAGTVDFQQTATGLKVRLGSIVDVLGDRYDPVQIARIQSSTASNVYLSLADLQAQGVPISYDPVYDEFNVGKNDTRPKAARKVHMDQISTPERGLTSTAMGQVPRR